MPWDTFDVPVILLTILKRFKWNWIWLKFRYSINNPGMFFFSVFRCDDSFLQNNRTLYNIIQHNLIFEEVSHALILIFKFDKVKLPATMVSLIDFRAKVSHQKTFRSIKLPEIDRISSHIIRSQLIQWWSYLILHMLDYEHCDSKLQSEITTINVEFANRSKSLSRLQTVLTFCFVFIPGSPLLLGVWSCDDKVTLL